MNQQAAPYVLAAGQARSHPGAFPAIKAGAADTGGLFTFCDGVLGPRTPGPALHVHDETDECFYVIDGHLQIQVGEERHDLGPGCFAWLPRHIPHAYANASDSPVRAVSMHVPGGIEEFFAAQGAYFAQLQGPPDPEQIAAIWAGHPGRIVGPPIQVDAAPAAAVPDPPRKAGDPEPAKSRCTPEPQGLSPRTEGSPRQALGLEDARRAGTAAATRMARHRGVPRCMDPDVDEFLHRGLVQEHRGACRMVASCWPARAHCVPG